MNRTRPLMAGILAVMLVAACTDGGTTNDGPDDTAGPSSGILVDGGLTIPEAFETDATGILAVQGFFFDDGTGPRLCELLAESFPPQCGGAELPLADTDFALEGLQTEGSVTWSDAYVVVLGELLDGTLHPSQTSI